MNKNNWYLKRKKINIDILYCRWLLSCAFLYILVSSIIFLFQYLNKDFWNEIIKKNTIIFTDTTLTASEKSNIVKIFYLSKFWGSVGLMILLQISIYIYTNKVKYGYLFIVIWNLIIIGLLIVDFFLVKADPLLYVWKIFPLFILEIYLMLIAFDLYGHRKRLNMEFYIKLKKGEI